VSEFTLGGYLAQHERPPAFGGSDGQPYSVGLWVDDAPDERGRYGAALVFVRWSQSGERPVGHLDSEILAWGESPGEAEARLKLLSLYDVKQALEDAIRRAPEAW
jgi:hypothetical protein